ncbi:hypothetical protein [Fructobacillus parabroussonetiae]|uniref:Uncharacterized protein n=1 Tax=Fructobacillus parabroussonetiae TaxID=2713174 RepID=A0ABS5QXQ0_9LACO|nr:hypothetical protein [Fructobacillus parabroussonetiae]MBS9337974.1 hypothetical protein [Fructobacillus parabroussonetiae]
MNKRWPAYVLLPTLLVLFAFSALYFLQLEILSHDVENRRAVRIRQAVETVQIKASTNFLLTGKEKGRIEGFDYQINQEKQRIQIERDRVKKELTLLINTLV